MTVESGDEPIEASYDFSFDSQDEIEGRIIEAVCQRRNIRELIRELNAEEINFSTCEKIAACIAYIADAKKPRLAADYVAWISGMRIRQGISLPQLAKKHGISKQAFCQAALRLAKELGIKPTRAMRSELAKLNMSKAHFKNSKV